MAEIQNFYDLCVFLWKHHTCNSAWDYTLCSSISAKLHHTALTQAHHWRDSTLGEVPRIDDTLAGIDRSGFRDENIWWLNVWMVNSMLMKNREILDHLLNIGTDLDLSEATLHEVFFIEWPAVYQFMDHVKILLIMEEQVHSRLIWMVNWFILSERRNYFSPTAAEFLLFNNLQNEELLRKTRAHFPNNRMRTDAHWLNDLVVLNELSSFILIIVS